MSVERRNGLPPVLTTDEENVFAYYVCEMALRWVGLGQSDIPNLVQNLLNKGKKKKIHFRIAG